MRKKQICIIKRLPPLKDNLLEALINGEVSNRTTFYYGEVADTDSPDWAIFFCVEVVGYKNALTDCL